MKKKSASFLSVLLVCSLLLTSVSCSEKEASAEESKTDTQSTGDISEVIESTEADEKTEERIQPDIPMEADFGGDEIRFIHWAGWEGTVRYCRDICVEGLTGEIINDTVYNRNLDIESRYNVKLAVDIIDLNQVNNEVSKQVQAGDDTYDVVFPILLFMHSLSNQGYLVNLHEVPNMDLTKPWWDQNSVESITYSNYLPAVSSSLSVNDKDGTAAMAFNKTLASNYGLPDIYELVREGKWTFDKLSELAASASQDIDGDGIITEADLYGMLGGNDVSYSFYFASGERMITNNEEGKFVLAFGGERSFDVMYSINNLMHQSWFFNHHEASNVDDGYYQKLFETGHGTFFWMRLDAVTDMRNGEADFGVIPNPKYTEEQNTYCSIVSPYTCGIMSLPITLTGEKLDEVGMILEAMAAYSHYTLIPAYIDTSLKTKHARDEESAEMMDIILSNRIFDPMMFYNFGSMRDSLLGWGAKDNLNLASIYRSGKKVTERTIKNFEEELAQALADNQ